MVVVHLHESDYVAADNCYKNSFEYVIVHKVALHVFDLKIQECTVWIVRNKGLYFTSVTEPRNSVRELKQQRRRRLLKRHLKSEFAMPQTLSRLFHLV